MVNIKEIADLFDIV